MKELRNFCYVNYPVQTGSLIVSPDGQILKDIGKDTGSISAQIEPMWKYMRTAGFGGNVVRNDDFINEGLRTDVFQG